jgi:protein SCO1/2
MPRVLENVGFEPPLNGAMPLDLPFRDETGRYVALRGYFGQQKPVVLAFVYYSCPMLCDQVEQGVVGALRMLSFNPGRDYDVVFISFDPRETPAMAAEKKKRSLAHFRRPETDSGWHFLTGAKESIDAATKAANFRYTFDAKSNLFAHASGVMLLTPDGRISRYFYGIAAGTCASGSWRPPRGKLAPPSITFCCFAITMTPPPPSTALRF